MKRAVDLSTDKFLTASEIAGLLKSTTASVRVMTSKGRIPRSAIIKIGRKILYSQKGIESWLAQEQEQWPATR